MSADLSTRTYLDAEQLADYLHRPSQEAARKWAYRAGVPVLHAGRQFQVRRRDVDLALEGRLLRRVRAA